MKKIYFLLFFFFNYTLAQTPSKDLKVGLLLSGGGAKGMAHIGVLKIIEEAGIRIDYIGGTSMGAVVGGLYAAGYTADQLETMMLNADLSALITDQFPRSSQSFYEKEDLERYILTLPFDDFKIRFPSSISKGIQVYDLLVKLTAPVHQITDFSQLPIPFFCVATDAETGRSLLLEEGFLPLAMNASAALPSVFEPVVIGDNLLIDGGVINNYPLYELQKKEVDFIIGVDVQTRLVDRNQLKSASELLLQISSFPRSNEMKKKREKTDLYIHPNLQDYSVLSFGKAEDIVALGETEARKHLNELTTVAQQQQRTTTNKKQAIKGDSIQLNQVHIKGNTRLSRAYVMGKLRLKPPTKTNFDKLHEGTSNLASTSNFSQFRYTLEPANEGVDMHLNLTENSNQSQIRFSLHYDELYKSAALFNLTSKRLLANNDVASLDFIFGDQLRYKFDYYIDNGFYWSVGLRSRFNKFNTNLSKQYAIAAGIPSVEFNTFLVSISDWSHSLYAETLFREKFALGAGIEHKKIVQKSNALLASSNQFLYLEDASYWNGYGFMKFDTLDSSYFPTKGAYISGNISWYFDGQSQRFDRTFKPFSIAKAQMGICLPMGNMFSLLFTAQGGFTINPPQNNSLDFILGGYGNHFINNYEAFIGYEPLSFGGDSFVKSDVIIDYNFTKSQHLKLKANFANAGDGIFMNQEWLKIRKTGYGIGYGLETLLGPLELTYAYTPELSQSIWYLNLGWWF